MPGACLVQQPFEASLQRLSFARGPLAGQNVHLRGPVPCRMSRPPSKDRPRLYALERWGGLTERALTARRRSHGRPLAGLARAWQGPIPGRGRHTEGAHVREGKWLSDPAFQAGGQREGSGLAGHDGRGWPVNAVAEHTGKVGVIGRLGNVAWASFGLKSRSHGHRAEVDIAKLLSRMLPYVVLATAIVALSHPPSFAWFGKKYYAPALGGIMLSIGVQLSVKDFIVVFKRPLPVAVGYVAQYGIKPALAVGLAALFRIPAVYAAGFILTGSVAGAQLSSYGTYLGDGDVAFSIVLTSLSTITSVVMTPFLSKVLIGSVVPVDAVAMAKSILQVVICPVFAGLALNTYAPKLVQRIKPVMPLVAMVCTSLCIGSPLALNRHMLVSLQGLQLLLPVLAFHISAFTAGYWLSVASPWRQDEKIARTVSICTGMQSSTLAMLLASQFLGASHMVPPACSVVIMASMGLSLGSFWGKDRRIRDDVGHMLGLGRRQRGSRAQSAYA